MKECGTTHYNACRCREAHFAEMERKLKVAETALKRIEEGPEVSLSILAPRSPFEMAKCVASFSQETAAKALAELRKA